MNNFLKVIQQINIRSKIPTQLFVSTDHITWCIREIEPTERKRERERERERKRERNLFQGIGSQEEQVGKLQTQGRADVAAGVWSVEAEFPLPLQNLSIFSLKLSS